MKRKINIPDLKEKQLNSYNQAMTLLLDTTSHYFSLNAIKDMCTEDYYVAYSNYIACLMGLSCELYLKGLLLKEIELGYEDDLSQETNPVIKNNKQQVLDKIEKFVLSITDQEVFDTLTNSKRDFKNFLTNYNNTQSASDKIINNEQGYKTEDIIQENLRNLGHNISEAFNLYIEKKGPNNALGKRMKIINDSLNQNPEFAKRYPGKNGLIDVYQEIFNSNVKFKEPFINCRYPFEYLGMPNLREKTDSRSIANYDLFSFLIMLSTIAEDELDVGLLLVNEHNNDGFIDSTRLIPTSDDKRYYYFDDNGNLQRVYKQDVNNSVTLEYDTRSLDYLSNPSKIDNHIPPYASIILGANDSFVCVIDGKLSGFAQRNGEVFPIDNTYIQKYQNSIDDYNLNPNKYSDQIRKTRIKEYMKFVSTEIEPTPDVIGQDTYDFGKTVTDEEKKSVIEEFNNIKSQNTIPDTSKDDEIKKLREELEKLRAEKDEQIIKTTTMLSHCLEFIEKVRHSFVGKLFFRDEMNKLPESKEDEEEQK